MVSLKKRDYGKFPFKNRLWKVLKKIDYGSFLSNLDYGKFSFKKLDYGKFLSKIDYGRF